MSIQVRAVTNAKPQKTDRKLANIICAHKLALNSDR